MPPIFATACRPLPRTRRLKLRPGEGRQQGCRFQQVQRSLHTPDGGQQFSPHQIPSGMFIIGQLYYKQGCGSASLCTSAKSIQYWILCPFGIEFQIYAKFLATTFKYMPLFRHRFSNICPFLHNIFNKDRRLRNIFSLNI